MESSNASTTLHKSEAASNPMSETKLANVITPIAKIIDNIGPIIAPLLRSSTHATKERQRAFAATISQIKENLKYNISERANIRPNPYIDEQSLAQQTPEFTRRRHGYPQAFVRVASVPLAEQAARATRNAHAQPRRASLDLSRSTSLPYFTAPPTGYEKPLPFALPTPLSLSTPAYYSLESQKKTSSLGLSSVSSSEAGNAAHSLAKIPLPRPLNRGTNDNTGYERGRSQVKSVFVENSGIMLGAQEAPLKGNVSPPSSSVKNDGFGGEGFAGVVLYLAFHISFLSSDNKTRFDRTSEKEMKYDKYSDI
ncbi:hypothetical protein KIN20_002575 [Parelaphostrongylus tenuis]|uniref:Uncharacterized protein n=1 Tax=Parelaphostrongylus tenuis TaxID=148309 RepID=A0AAD5LVZ2_PARTN|nr:hypothetical protein KIN20_002575 [Parelaphostrongylus tenuis]